MLVAHEPVACHLEWGLQGVHRGLGRGDILVIVDTLSFSTAVVAALDAGVVIYPCGADEEASMLAVSEYADIAVARQEVPSLGRFSLSPGSFLDASPGTRIVLQSLNGATCCRQGRFAPALLVGALVNAGAVAAASVGLMVALGASVTVVACGERWPEPTQDGPLRVAIEDWLGAGAIIAELACRKTAEGKVAAAAFLGVRSQIADILAECASGRELRERGFSEDVRTAAELNRYQVVPILRGERFELLDL